MSQDVCLGKIGFNSLYDDDEVTWQKVLCTWKRNVVVKEMVGT